MGKEGKNERSSGAKYRKGQKSEFQLYFRNILKLEAS